MSLTCRIRITIRDMAEARIVAVYESLEPDNVNFPAGMSMEMKREPGALHLDFECSKEAVASLAPTIDEVLGHVQTALEVTK